MDVTWHTELDEIPAELMTDEDIDEMFYLLTNGVYDLDNVGAVYV